MSQKGTQRAHQVFNIQLTVTTDATSYCGMFIRPDPMLPPAPPRELSGNTLRLFVWKWKDVIKCVYIYIYRERERECIASTCRPNESVEQYDTSGNAKQINTLSRYYCCCLSPLDLRVWPPLTLHYRRSRRILLSFTR